MGGGLHRRGHGGSVSRSSYRCREQRDGDGNGGDDGLGGGKHPFRGAKAGVGVGTHGGAAPVGGRVRRRRLLANGCVDSVDGNDAANGA